jgi:hypothetical protein
MKYLNFLNLPGNHLELLFDIFTQCTLLRILSFEDNFICDDNILIENIDKIIGSIKYNLMKRAYPLILVLKKFTI